MTSSKTEVRLQKEKLSNKKHQNKSLNLQSNDNLFVIMVSDKWQTSAQVILRCGNSLYIQTTYITRHAISVFKNTVQLNWQQTGWLNDTADETQQLNRNKQKNTEPLHSLSLYHKTQWHAWCLSETSDFTCCTKYTSYVVVYDLTVIWPRRKKTFKCSTQSIWRIETAVDS